MNNHGKIIAAAITLAALLFSLFSFISLSWSEKPRAESARAAALYEPTTKSFLYSKNADERLAMASTTKIMTALVALEECDGLDFEVEISDAAVGIIGSSAYFKGKEVYTMRDLLYIMMLRSANDAATQVAITVGGSPEGFAELMNKKALALGLKDSSFKNPSGLDADGHYTTAHDLAIITAAALEFPEFKEISSRYVYTATDLASGEESVYINHNKLLNSYDGCIGVKTGYTKKSGRSLVSAAERDGLSLIAVTINAPDDWQEHRELLDYGFDTLEHRTVIRENEYSRDVRVVAGGMESVRVTNTHAFSLVCKRGAELTVTEDIPYYLVAPITAGNKVGSLYVRLDGELVATLDLIATEGVNKKRSFLNK